MSTCTYNNILKPIDDRDSTGNSRRDSIVSLATICNNYSSDCRESMETAVANEPNNPGGRILGNEWEIG